MKPLKKTLRKISFTTAAKTDEKTKMVTYHDMSRAMTKWRLNFDKCMTLSPADFFQMD